MLSGLSADQDARNVLVYDGNISRLDGTHRKTSGRTDWEDPELLKKQFGDQV